MLTTVRITKAQAVLLQTMKITDETMSVKEYVAGALAECTTDNLVVKKVKMTVEESALRAFLDEMYEIDVVRDIISMDVESADDDE